MRIQFYSIFFFILFISISCSDEITHSRSAFTDIRVSEYVFNSEQGYIFYPETPFEVRIEDYDENKFYSYTDIVFQGWADAKETKLSDDKIRTDIRDYLYNKYPGNLSIENPVADFIREDLQSIKIYSNRSFNTIKSGESLNQFFDITTRLVIFSKSKYTVYDGDILKQKSFDNTFVPLGVKVKLKSPPQKTDKYDFFIEIKTDKYLYSSKIISVSLNGMS